MCLVKIEGKRDFRKEKMVLGIRGNIVIISEFYIRFWVFYKIE